MKCVPLMCIYRGEFLFQYTVIKVPLTGDVSYWLGSLIFFGRDAQVVGNAANTGIIRTFCRSDWLTMIRRYL